MSVLRTLTTVTMMLYALTHLVASAANARGGMEEMGSLVLVRAEVTIKLAKNYASPVARCQ